MKDKNIRVLLGLYRILETAEANDEVWTENYLENLKMILTGLYQFLTRYGLGDENKFRMVSEAAFGSLFSEVKGKRMNMPRLATQMSESEILTVLGFLYQSFVNDPSKDSEKEMIIGALEWAMQEMAPKASQSDLLGMSENIWKSVVPSVGKGPVYVSLPISCSLKSEGDGDIKEAWLDKNGETMYFNFTTDKGYGYRLASWLLSEEEQENYKRLYGEAI